MQTSSIHCNAVRCWLSPPRGGGNHCYYARCDLVSIVCMCVYVFSDTFTFVYQFFFILFGKFSVHPHATTLTFRLRV